MNAKELAHVALKVAGIYSLVTGLTMITGVMRLAAFYRGETEFPYIVILTLLLPSLLLILLAVLLLWGTKWAGEMLNLPVDIENSKKLEVDGFMSTAFAVVGIILLADGLSQAVWLPAYIKAHLSTIDPVTGSTFPIFLSEPLYKFFQVIFEAGLGLYLFIGGDGLARFWKTYRDKKVLID